MAAKIDEIDSRIASLRRIRDELARVVGCACDSLDHCTCGAAYLVRTGKGAGGAPGAPARHQRRKRRQHAAADRARRSRAALARRPPRRAGARATEAGSCCGHAPASSPTAAGAASRRSSPRSSGATSSCSRRCATALQVVLWFEHDLYDQLQLLDVLALAHAEEAEPELIVVGSFPGRPSFAGLGELTAGELETLWPSRRPAAPASLEAAAAAWAAVRAPEPTALAGWATRETGAAAVSRARAAAAARGAARAGRRALGDGTTSAPGGRRRRAHASGRIRRGAAARGCALPRRRLVLPGALGARAGRDEAPRDRRRRAATRRLLRSATASSSRGSSCD